MASATNKMATMTKRALMQKGNGFILMNITPSVFKICSPFKEHGLRAALKIKFDTRRSSVSK
jgi:hypothetical protein